jgi:hypothetical protein
VQRVEEVPGSGGLIAASFVLAVVFAAGVLTLLGGVSSNVAGGFVVAPLLLLISLPILARQARREMDSRMLPILSGALILKLAGAIVRYYVAFSVYGGVADAAAYDGWGIKLGAQFRHLDFTHTGLHSLAGTDFIRFLTGLVYAVVGPNRLGGFLVFSWLGFWGLFLFYRAFTIAMPEGRKSTYAALVLFLPSLLFWPSSIGKEAWMMFALGIAAYGAARVLSGSAFRGLFIAGLGMWFASLVRPHVAGLFAIALAAAFLLKRPRAELRGVGVLAKTVGFAVLVLIAGLLVLQTDDYLRSSKVDAAPSEDVSAVLQNVAARTSEGGSNFVPSIAQSPARAPWAVVTVIFRPLFYEAATPQALLSAMEGTFLLILCIARRKWIAAALRSIRRQPFVGLAGAYSVLFIFAFSAIANFGLLARERVQLLPLFLVLLCVPPAKEHADETARL